jgi:uncharacterized protein
MIEIGKYNKLKVARRMPQGYYLIDEEENEVLLPNKYIPADTLIGDQLTVFVYNDSSDRIIATTLHPKVMLHQFARLKAEMVNQFGAFLDWGLEKQLFVPFKEQTHKMIEGLYYLVYMYLDEQTNRLVASAKINKFLSNENLTVTTDQEVDVIMWEPTDLGMNVIINNVHKGLVYDNQLFAQVKPGDVRKGYIKTIREDNKIDVLLQQQGYKNVEPNADRIVQTLQNNGGFLPLNDKSEPIAIARMLEMSKKTFKKAVGLLYKQHIIDIEDEGIRLK